MFYALNDVRWITDIGEVRMTTLKEKVEVYESLLHALHFASSVTMNHERVGELLGLISNWSYAHRQGNGELSCKEQMECVSRAFLKMKEVV